MSLVTEVAALAALRSVNPAAVTGPDADVVTLDLTETIRGELSRPDFAAWAARVASTGYCANPIHLRGLVHEQSPDGTVRATSERRSLLVRCGNRRAAVCPSCSFTYAGDVWQVLVAGMDGGRHDVPRSVRRHPLVFVTLTAPSFGLVHTTRSSSTGHTLPCRPRRPDDRHRCRHGKPLWCQRTHDAGDIDEARLLGTPLCADCFDYAGLVAFNWQASALWGRFTIDLRRTLAHSLGLTEAQLRDVVRVRYAKVAEFQRRGVAHFHAVIRLDGPPVDADPADLEDPGDPFPPPGIPVSTGTLAVAIRAAAGKVRLTVPDPTDADGDGLAVVLRFGPQVDVRPINAARTLDGDDLAGDDLTAEKVAAYVAKYATKAADDFGLPPAVRRGSDVDRLGLDVTDHTRRILAAVDRLVIVHPYAHKWVHQLGFRGHFQTKSRHFSVTLGALRQQRRAWREEHPTAGLDDVRAGTVGPARDLGDGEDQDGEETTLVIRWTFAGTGHRTPAEAALAAAAADLGRSRRTRPRDAA